MTFAACEGALADERVTSAADLRLLSREDLKELGLKIGDRNKVLQWQAGVEGAAVPLPPQHRPPPIVSSTMVAVENPKIVALVPMKHTSVRVPGKNYRQLKDKPLCSWILTTLSQCPLISEIVVDTDSDIVKDLLSRDFPCATQHRSPIILHDKSDFAREQLCANHRPAGSFAARSAHERNPDVRYYAS